MTPLSSVKSIMNRNLICISEELKFSEILKLIYDTPVSHLPVTRGQKIVGIISKEDILKKLKYLSWNTTGKSYSQFVIEHIKAIDIMTSQPVCVYEEDSVKFATELILKNKFHALPVVNQDLQLVGLLTGSDLLKAYFNQC